MPHWLSRFHILYPPSLAIFFPFTPLTFARGMPWVSPWIIMAMWVTGTAGLSVNLTSSHTIPAGGTVTVVWAPDDVTVNPSQFSLYVSREGGADETVATQVVDASTSGTATMVVPPATSPGVFQVLGYTGTNGPTVGTGPALWGDEIIVVAAVSSVSGSQSQSSTGTTSSSSSASGSQSQSSTGTTSSPASQPSNTSPQSSNTASQTSNTASQTSTGASTSSTASVSQSSPSATSTASGVGGGGGTDNSRIPGQTASKHGIATGAIVGIVLALIFALLWIGVFVFYLRRKRQRARHRFSGTGTNYPLDPSVPVAIVTPFTSSPPMTTTKTMMTQTPVIREKDTILGSFPSSTASRTEFASGSSSSSRSASDHEHQEALARAARLEHEVQILRAQQQQNLIAFDDAPPPEYETL
ncbi:hypothetical protein C8R45DRAFT_293323 [Mycena sanguinolenta]|nr:hypothetical protein C8R45DRAFT_293323 [Mycena sanguinolenta]